MSNAFIDLFNGDAFSMTTLTAAFNKLDHVPGRAGELCFAGYGEGEKTTSVNLEYRNDAITLIPATVRGGPSQKETQTKSNLIKLDIPFIQLEDKIHMASIQNVRKFGTMDTELDIQSAVNDSLRKQAGRHDLTLENLRLGAIKGKVLDADGTSVIVDLFSTFGILNSLGFPQPEPFAFALNTPGEQLRTTCQNIVRYIHRKAKVEIPPTAKVWAFAGDNFFDKLVSHPQIKEVWDGFASAEAAMRKGGGYAFGVFEFGGIFFENYRGSDDNTTVAIDPNECRIFLTGVDGIWAERFAPAAFNDTVNQPGLPRYARIAPDRRFQQFVEMHTEQNPLPICLRPQTLLKGTIV